MAAGTEGNGIDGAPQNFNNFLLVSPRTCDLGLRLEKLEVWKTELLKPKVWKPKLKKTRFLKPKIWKSKTWKPKIGKTKIRELKVWKLKIGISKIWETNNYSVSNFSEYN